MGVKSGLQDRLDVSFFFSHLFRVDSLIIVGILLTFLGVALNFLPKFNCFGNLPGDIKIEGDNFSFYFPLTTCLILSLILTLVLRIFG